jgi:hypothetical protein
VQVNAVHRYHINDLLPLGLDLAGMWLERTFTKTMQVCQGSNDFYHRRYLKERACIPQVLTTTPNFNTAFTH